MKRFSSGKMEALGFLLFVSFFVFSGCVDEADDDGTTSPPESPPPAESPTPPTVTPTPPEATPTPPLVTPTPQVATPTPPEVTPTPPEITPTPLVTPTPAPQDLDLDGFAVDDGDCNDGDPAINPAAAERCDGVDNNCDGVVDGPDATDASTWYQDGDGDGYGVSDSATISCFQPPDTSDTSGDCDDLDASVNPDALEVCDGFDNDCDNGLPEGGIDENGAQGAVTWYADVDDDGYGDPAVSIEACSPPDGYVADQTDCDDTDSPVHPGADELCDGIDNDCDQDFPENDPDGLTGTDEDDAIGAATWYADVDQDGYGLDDGELVRCVQPPDTAATGGDCDDTNPAINPGAVEVCNDLDDDCDEMVDEETADAPTWYSDGDNDGWGDPSSFVLACEMPPGYVADPGEAGFDCDDTRSVVFPGATELCNGLDDDCDGETDEADAADAPTWYPDEDNDGYGDPAVSSRSCDAPGSYVGNALDCDDGETLINPEATEICNGLDDDCDLEVDEDDAADASTWYADKDGDGYGDQAQTTITCYQPDAYVGNDGTSSFDCDDAASQVYPGAPEYCNGVDDDCDGQTDEPDAVEAATWYTDADGDGYGGDAESTRACTQPEGYSASSDDCNESDPAINPAAVEVCDGVDNNCDGASDEDGAADAPLWHPDADEDGFGDETVSYAACVQPSGYLADASDCNDADPSQSPDGLEVCDGADNDCNGEVDGSDAADAVVYYADEDGDGYGTSSGATTRACEPPGGYSSFGNDCDDADPGVYPGSGVESYLFLVSICIDGSDWLYIQGDSIWWIHRNYAAAGTHSGCGSYNQTYIDGDAWSHTWSGNTSDTYTIANPLPALPVTVLATRTRGRGAVTVTQQPSSSNNYTAAILFDDDSYGGPDIYDVAVTYTCQ